MCRLWQFTVQMRRAKATLSMRFYLCGKWSAAVMPNRSKVQSFPMNRSLLWMDRRSRLRLRLSIIMRASNMPMASPSTRIGLSANTSIIGQTAEKHWCSPERKTSTNFVRVSRNSLPLPDGLRKTGCTSQAPTSGTAPRQKKHICGSRKTFVA